MKTLRTYPYEAGRVLYPIDFTLGFLSREHIFVYTGEDPETQINYTWLNDFSIQINEPFLANETLKIRRIVPKDILFNDYENNARLIEKNLDDSFKQPLMILEEIEDGLFSTAGSHNVLTERNALDAHPIESITGLAEKLAQIDLSPVSSVPLRETKSVLNLILDNGVFDFNEIQYVIGSNGLFVQLEGGGELFVNEDYFETSSTQITLDVNWLVTIAPEARIIVRTNNIIPDSNFRGEHISIEDTENLGINTVQELYSLLATLNASSGGEKTYSSFAEMVSSNNGVYSKVSTSGYYADWIGFGSGTYIKTNESGLTPGDTDFGSYWVDLNGYKWILDHKDKVYVSQFGCKPENELFNNRERMQASIDYCTRSGANWVVDPLRLTWDGSAYEQIYFGLDGWHPDHEGFCLVFPEPRQMFVFGNTSRVSSIRYYGTTAGEAVIKFAALNGSDWGYIIDGLGVSATADETDQLGCVLNHAISARNPITIARCQWTNCTFAGGLINVMQVHGYMMPFINCEFRYGHTGGLYICGPEGQSDGNDPVTTSITLMNVWSRYCGGSGLRFRNQAWYVNLISCGVDGAGSSIATAINRPQWAYEFGNVRGATINGCGCEEVDRVAKFVSCDSVNINSMKGTGWGKTDGTIADYAIEISGNGTSVNISGWPKGTAVTTGSAPTKKFNYVLGLTKSDSAMGNLLVQIMDNGINYLETFYVPNTGNYTIPIVWPNDTADGAHRAQRKTGNVTWPNKNVIIAPSAGQFGLEGCVRKVINIGGEDTFTTHKLLRHYGGNSRTTYAINVVVNSQSGGAGAKWDGVANVTASGKNIAYFTKTSGNSGAVPTIVWNGDFLEFSMNANTHDAIIEIIVYSEVTSISVEFLK